MSVMYSISCDERKVITYPLFLETPNGLHSIAFTYPGPCSSPIEYILAKHRHHHQPIYPLSSLIFTPSTQNKDLSLSLSLRSQFRLGQPEYSIPGSLTTTLSVSSDSALRSAFVISNWGVPRIFLESSFAGT